MTGPERRRVLEYARRALAVAVRDGRPDPAPPADGPLALPAAAFVTLRRRADGALRGCIGRLHAAEPLGAVIAAMAAAAALEDPRFDPVSSAEVDGLEVEVSILGPFVPSSDPARDLRVGIHGLRIRLGDRSGLLLPQVATEQGWGAAAFLEAVCRKADLHAGAWRDPAARVDLFEAEVIEEGPAA
ncbi:MAG TPA: AmmeMemoRadiSam system protein A [Planctomycetota bacterium]|nr:AmmeMemoRadiSam system protein A [Planctomycetota bacterium]